MQKSVNLITYTRCKYLINKAPIENEKCHYPVGMGVHILFLKLKPSGHELATMAKALNRSVKIVLQSLWCIRFVKEKDLSAFHASSRKDAQNLQKCWGDWCKYSVKHATNVASAS